MKNIKYKKAFISWQLLKIALVVGIVLIFMFAMYYALKALGIM